MWSWRETILIWPLSLSLSSTVVDIVTAEPLNHVVFQDEGSPSHWQPAPERVEGMLCERVQLSSQRSWPEADGVLLRWGNPLTQFYISGCCATGIYLLVDFSESQRSVCKMQRRQSGRTVGPDQFLWLQHPNFCPGCQSAWQIPHRYEGRSWKKTFKSETLFQATTRIRVLICFLILVHKCACLISQAWGKKQDWPYLTLSHRMLTHT